MLSEYVVDESDKTYTSRLTEGKVLQITASTSTLITSNQSNPTFLKFPAQKNILKFKEVSVFCVEVNQDIVLVKVYQTKNYEFF